jgi:TP901 family phage tail tape measure protein
MTSTGFNLGSAYGSVVITTNVGEAMNTARQQFDAGIAGMASSIKSWGDSLTQMGAQMSVLSQPLRGVITTGLEVVADFDDIMSSIEARTGSSADEMEKIRAFAREQGASSVFSAQQVGEALLGLMTSGMSVEQALATLPSVLQAATADSAELGSTADIVTNIMASFGLEAENSQEIVDALARASGASKASITSLGQGFGNVGGIAKQFGLDVEETAAILAIFSNNGIQGAEAGTQLRSMLNHMMSDAAPTTAAWKKLGVSLYDAQGNMRDLNLVMQELDAALDKLPVEEQNRLMGDLAGTYGILGFTALRSSMSIEEMQGVMEGQADASSIAAQMMGTLRNMINSLMGSWETLLEIALAPTVEEYLKPIINSLIEMVNGIAVWAQQNPDLTQTIVILGAAIATLGPALVAIGLAISIAGGALALLLSPITLVSAGIFALAVVFRDQLTAIVTSVTAFVQEATRPFTNFISRINLVIAHFNYLRNSGTEFFDALRTEIKIFADDFLRLFGITDEAAANIEASLLEMVTTLETMIGEVQDIIRVGLDYFTRLSESGASVFEILRQEINILTPMITEFLGITGETADAIQQALWEAVTSIETLFESAGNTISGALVWLSTLGRYIGETIGQFISLRNQGMTIFDTLRTQIQWQLRGFLALVGITGDTASDVQTFLIGLVNELQVFVDQAGTALATLQQSVLDFWDRLADASPDGFISDLLEATGAADLFQSALNELQGFIGRIGDAFETLNTGLSLLTTTFRFLRTMGYSTFGAIAQEINMFADTVLGALGISGDAAGVIKSWLVTAVLDIERLFNAASSVVSGVWAWLSTLGSQLGSIDLSGLSQFIGPLYHAAMLLLSLTNPLYLAWEVLTILGVDFIGIIEDVAEGVSQFFNVLADGGSLTDAFTAVFGPEVVAAVLTGVQVVEDAINGLIGLVSDLWAFVSPALTQFGNWFTVDVLPAISDLINNSVLPALQSIGDYLSQLWALVAPHLEAFATWFLYDALPKIQQFISETVIPAIGDFIDALTRIWNDVSPFLLELADWFLNDALPTVLSFINDVAIPVIQDMIDIIASIWNVVSPVLESLYSWFITEGLPFIMEQLETGRETFQKLIDVMAGIWTGVEKGVNDFKGGLDALVKWVDTTFVQPIVNLVNSVISAFSSIWNSIQGPVNDFKNNIQGILDGISRAINDVRTALGVVQSTAETSVQGYQTAANVTGEVAAGVASGQYSIFDVLGAAGRSIASELSGGAIPALSTGADYIKQDGLAYLHEGEAVLTAQENAARQSSQGNGPVFEIHIGQIIANDAAGGRAAGEELSKTLKEKIRFSGGSFDG